MTDRPIAIMWFRNDLRLADNPALRAATQWARENDGVVLPVFVLDPVISDQLGGATRWWLEKSLLVLDRAIADRADVSANMAENAALRLFVGKSSDIFDAIIESQPVGALFWNRLYDKPSITHKLSAGTSPPVLTSILRSPVMCRWPARRAVMNPIVVS